MPPRSEWAVHKGDRRVQVTELRRLVQPSMRWQLMLVIPPPWQNSWRILARNGLRLVVLSTLPLHLRRLRWSTCGLICWLRCFEQKCKVRFCSNSLSASQPVEFFVNFSTTTAILGSAQLAHYAASNAVLDALACRRSAEGKPALSINWGSWDKLLSVSEEEREHIARGGLRPMATEKGLAALELLIKARATRAIVAEVDWPVLRAVYV